MCVNDLVVQGAEPLFFLDYYACSKLENDVAQKVIAGIARACKDSGCALIGGETAEMPGMYKPKDFDLAGFSVGAVERDAVLPRRDEIEAGDVIIGMPASGVHSNGFSLVRKIMETHSISYSDKCEFDESKTYADVFLTPTELYVKPCLAIHKKSLAKAFCHITGGGFIENIPRILPDHLGFYIDYDKYKLPALFAWLKEKASLDNSELFKTFNCGTGMVVVAKETDAAEVISTLAEFGYKSKAIGMIVSK
jgi:phosphoribosylaminoimidazole synthetase